MAHPNPLINALAGTSWLDVGHDNEITYRFAGTWPADERAAVLAAMAAWSAVADVSFKVLPLQPFPLNLVQPDIIERRVDEAEMIDITGSDYNGWHEFPQAGGAANGYFNIQSPIWTAGGFDPGGSAFELCLHELGHALGLAHTHDKGNTTGVFPGVSSSNDTGDNDLNQNLYSVMSYIDYKDLSPLRGYMMGPMAFDIAAIQFMYGANMSAHTGNDFYRLPDVNQAGTGYKCLWDAGGNDTIYHWGAGNAVIDLRPATLINAPGGGGFLSSVTAVTGGFTIAAGARIENAIGGDGNDKLVGNSLANRLTGGLGQDGIEGNSGDDTIIGGRGADRLKGGLGFDDFDYNNLNESCGTARDIISDFRHLVDDIDLSTIDANSNAAGNQAFSWIGAAAFSGVAGQLHFSQLNGVIDRLDRTYVEADVNGDRVADLTIQLTGLIDLTSLDFIR